MRTCIDHLLALPRIDGPRMNLEAEFLSSRLDQLRIQKSITNDAYLDAGAVQGAIQLIANLIDMGISQTEIQNELRQQLVRAQKLEEKHPGLNQAIESGRAS